VIYLLRNIVFFEYFFCGLECVGHSFTYGRPFCNFTIYLGHIIYTSVTDPDQQVLGLPDSDPLVRGTDPFIIKQKL
jgi:hypothetical protein